MPAANAPEAYPATSEDYEEMLDYLESESAINDAAQDLSEKLRADPAVSEATVALLYPTDESASSQYRSPLAEITPAELQQIKERLQEAAAGQALDPEETRSLAQDTAYRLIGPARLAVNRIAAGTDEMTELTPDYAPLLPETYNALAQSVMALLQPPLLERERSLTQYLADPTQEQSLTHQDDLIRLTQQAHQVMRGNPPQAYPEPEPTMAYWRREENRSEYGELHAAWQEQRQEYGISLAYVFKTDFGLSESSMAQMIEDYPRATGRFLEIYLEDAEPGSEAVQLLLDQLSRDTDGSYPQADLREALEQAYRKARE